MLRYFRIKLFPKITTLFYRSQLHVPMHVRNRGWGSRYRGLGILTPPQTFFFEIIRISVMCQRNAQIFLNQLFPNISTYFNRSQLHVPLYVRNTGWGSRYRGVGILTSTQFDNSEIRNVVICQRKAQIILGDIYSE